MYAKFVAPSMIVSVKDVLNDRLIVNVLCANKDKSKSYLIMFEHTDNVFTAKSHEKTKPNIITSVSVSLTEIAK